MILKKLIIQLEIQTEQKNRDLKTHSAVFIDYDYDYRP